MYTLSLKNKQILGCMVFEIKSIPDYANLSENEEQAQEKNRLAFFQILAECYRYCLPGSAVLELLWVSCPVDKRDNVGEIHLYFIVRIISKALSELEQRMKAIRDNIIPHLQSGGFQTSECDVLSLQKSNLLPDDNTFVNAVVKSEQCTVHAQSVIPYYYTQPIAEKIFSDFSMLSRTLEDLPGSAVSFQVLPDTYNSQETAAITEMYSMLNRFTSGGMMPGEVYHDPMAENAKTAYAYIYNNLHQPMYRYNILTFGNQNQCAALSSQVTALLKTASLGQFITVNLNSERISMKQMFPYYPWNLNVNLIRKYRNRKLWQAMQNIQTMPLLFRIPYFITGEEAVSFFRLPIGNKKVVGIKCRDVIQNVQNIDSRVTNTDNIIFGKLIDDTHKIDIGCPAKSLTKHALVVGMPGTGKTTFSVNLLLQMYKKGIPFLTIEPTKTEYRAMIDSIDDLQIFTPGNNRVSPFVINPFIPPKGITVEQYIPSLASAFKAAFSMPSPLDTIFQQAIQEAYVKYGWKDYSTAQDSDVILFGLHEFILVFKSIIARQKYSAEVKGNLQSGGILRLRNLIEQNANIYDTIQTVPLEDILSKPTVLELNAIDNEEQKSVLMALLLINICVYTKHNNVGDGRLKNLILIDDAHFLFKAQGNSDSAQSGNSAVRSLENMLAEIRSYGTSVVIADQSPSAVGSEVVKNTNVKVSFRLVDSHDRKTIAETTGMTSLAESQIPKLDVGQAFISYEYIKEPVLVQTPDIRKKESIRLSVPNTEVQSRMKYWDSHKEYLIPFRECKCSNFCKECSMKLRSDASFYAARFMQDYGTKITDVTSMCSYLKAIDTWMERQGYSTSNQVMMNNCVKIRLLRRIMQQKDIILTHAEYTKILKSYLNIE